MWRVRGTSRQHARSTRASWSIPEHSSPGRSKSYSWGRASKFQFCEQLFSISFFLFFFFFFFLISQITFVFPQSKALTHILPWPSDTLFSPRHINNCSPQPTSTPRAGCLGDTGKPRGEKKRKKKRWWWERAEFSKTHLRTYVTQSLCHWPLAAHPAAQAASLRGRGLCWQQADTRGESDALAGIPDSPHRSEKGNVDGAGRPSAYVNSAGKAECL